MFTLGVMAGKGGVGKSSLTVLLAYAFQKIGLRVGILDADVYGPSIRHMLAAGTLPRETAAKRLEPANLSGIEVMSLAFFQQFDKTAIFRAPIANGIIQQFLHQVDWGELDILLVDFPPGTGDIQLTLLQEASMDATILLTTPQEVSLIDVRKSYEMTKEMAVSVLGVVENMSYYQDPLTGEKQHIFGSGGGRTLAGEINRPLLKQIPIDPLICQSLDQGKSLFSEAVVSAAIDAIWELAIELSGQICDHGGATNKAFLKEIDNRTCEIFFGEQSVRLRYNELQKMCRCARCYDEKLEIALVDPDRVDPNLTIRGWRSIGNYGIQLTFSSGCSWGVYRMEDLVGV